MTSDLLDRLALQPGGSELLSAASQDGIPRAHLVGGSVRDLMLDRTPRELDVVVEGAIEPLLAALGGSPTVHERFGTASVALAGARVDLSRSRREHYAQPGALPDVTPAPLADDLARRDFTVNAIAVSLDDGAVAEVPGAGQDLAVGTLRVLHDQSFIDDPTRLLRLGRYAARLGFAPEPHTSQLVTHAVGTGALDTVSGARIGAELRLALGEADPVSALCALERIGVLAAIGISGTVVPTELHAALALLPDDGLVEVLLLAGVMSDQAAGATLARLDFTAAVRDRVLATLAAVPALAQALATCERPSDLRRLAASVPIEAVALAGAAGSDAAAANAQRWLDQLRHVGLVITGDDLLAAGVAEGPEIGRRLHTALDRRLDGELDPGREAELAAALEAP